MNRRRISLVLILLALFVFAAACAKKPVAVVNGDKITQADVDRTVSIKLGPAAAGMKDTDKKAADSQALQGLISERLIIQEARAKGITVSDEEANNQVAGFDRVYGKDALEKQLKNAKIDIKTFKGMMKDQIMIVKLLSALVPDGSVTDGDAMNFYKSKPAMFQAPARVKIRTVQAPTLEEANSVAAQMKSGGFDRVADKYLSSKTVGVGDYSWTATNLYGPELEKALSSIKTGSFGGPFKTHDGFLLVSVKERKMASVIPFDQVKEQIKTMLVKQKKKQAIMDLIASKRASADIKIYN